MIKSPELINRVTHQMSYDPNYPQAQYPVLQQAGYAPISQQYTTLQPQFVQQYVQQVQYAQPAQIIINPDDPPEKRLNDLQRKYEITPYYMNKLTNLRGAEFVLAWDNSGSMNNPVKSKDPAIKTRWDESQMISGIIVDIVTALDPTGADLFFFNPPKASNDAYRNIKQPCQLKPLFAVAPEGMTPTAATLTKIFAEKKDIAKERKVIVICATDGVATNSAGEPDMIGLRNVLEKGRSSKEKIIVNFLLCTDEDEIVKQFAIFDKKIKGVDVTDDYETEKAEIQEKKGKNHAFTMGNYIVKLIVGASDPEIDQQDETKSCCVIC
jgi:hypothetical protein